MRECERDATRKRTDIAEAYRGPVENVKRVRMRDLRLSAGGNFFSNLDIMGCEPRSDTIEDRSVAK